MVSTNGPYRRLVDVVDIWFEKPSDVLLLVGTNSSILRTMSLAGSNFM